MSDVFISYKQDERERMRPIAEGLRALGVDVWFDEQLQPDRAFTEEIEDLIKTCKAQIVCWSPASAKSEWVRGEADKGRLRAVLISVMIEPTELPAPFNMHHAESLAGWSGDARHPGWRKICDVIGRKIDRPGLGEYAALQASTEADTWKKWAQKYPGDPRADEAWAKAEELEIGAARARMARDREAALRAAEQKAAAPPVAPKPAPVSVYAAPPRKMLSPIVIGVAAMALIALIGAGVYFGPRVLVDHAAAQAIDSIPAADWCLDDDGVLVEKYLAKADMPTLQAAAASGNARAQMLLAMAYEHELGGLPQDDAKAFEFYTLAARESDPRALHNLAYMYAAGRGVALDKAEGNRMDLIAAEAGCPRAQNAAAIEYLQNDPPDAQNAILWYRRAAENGLAAANANLGLLYYEGKNVAQDFVEARRLFLAAPELATSQLTLGRLYRYGAGVEVDNAEAARYFALAAAQNDPGAQNELALMNYAGVGMPVNHAEAARLYRLCAETGVDQCLFYLGALYQKGEGVPLDAATAINYYRRAARLDYPEAKTALTDLGETW